jgi:hypothetical protein
MDVGYWLGAHFIKAPEDTLPLGFHYEPPYEGDLDIQLHIGAVSGAPIHQLTEIASQVCTSMLAFINLALGELATPVAPLHVLALREEGAQFESSVIIAVRERRPVTSELASHAAETFAADRAGMSPLEARALAVAARRYLTSLSEADQVDKYCDLWESCEFSTMFEMAKGESGQNRTGLGVASEAERS